MELDIREMSFQNVLDQILKPAGVKIGGFPEDMFLDMTESERESLSCNICYLIVNDCRQCDNKHLFCNTCVFAWSMTYGENSQKCPLCRNEQKEYQPSRETEKILQDKRVQCPEDDCSFKSPLKIFLMHSHGKQRFSNSHVDLESLRPERSHAGRMLVFPSLAGPGGQPRTRRGLIIRNQLQQGRMMINQMMLLLHLEMQLRQQAVMGFRAVGQQAEQGDVRVQRLDEVFALNEQLNEVGTILSNLLSTPARVGNNRSNSLTSTETPRLSEQLNASSQRSSSLSQVEPSAATVVRRRYSPIRHLTDSEDDDDDSDDDTSSMSSLASTVVNQNPRATINNDVSNSSVTSSRNQVTRLGSTLREGQSALDLARDRRTSTHAVLSGTAGRTEVRTDRSTAAAPVTAAAAAAPSDGDSLLNRRREQNRIDTVTERSNATPSAQRQVPTDNITNTSGSSTLQLPAIPTPRSLSSGTASEESGTSSEERPPSSSPASGMPRGSSALAHVMQDLRGTEPRNVTTTTTTRDDGVTISVTTSGPYRRQPTNLQPASSNNDGSQNSRGTETLAAPPGEPRPPSRTRESLSRLSRRTPIPDQRISTDETASSRPTTDATGTSIGGSILPASLYRRSQHTRLTQGTPDTPAQNTTSSTSSSNNNSRVSVSRISAGQLTAQLRRDRSNLSRAPAPSVDLSLPPPAQAAASSTRSRDPALRNSRPNAAVSRSTVAGGGRLTTRSREPGTRLSQRPRGSEPSTTTSSSNSSSSSSYMRGQPTTSTGVVRSRRRSEIHEELLMKGRAKNGRH